MCILNSLYIYIYIYILGVPLCTRASARALERPRTRCYQYKKINTTTTTNNNNKYITNNNNNDDINNKTHTGLRRRRRRGRQRAGVGETHATSEGGRADREGSGIVYYCSVSLV